jgi:dTDP-glucose 4,6-dehydratase
MTKLLLTGAAGFIGSHFARHLLDSTDWEVQSLDKLDDAGSLGRLEPLRTKHPTRMFSTWHDLRAPINPDTVMWRRGSVDYIVHMAAQSHVDRSILDPVGTLQDNVIGTANLLEYVRREQPQARVLYFSTDEVFGPAEAQSFDEHDAHYPTNPYAAGKSAAEQLIPAYAHQYGVQCVVTHCTNAYGPGQYKEKFIPLVVGKVLRGEVVQIHGRRVAHDTFQSSSRYYVHVQDIAEATLLLLEKGGVVAGRGTGRYNIAGDVERFNITVAQDIAKVLERELHYEPVERPPSRPEPDMRYALAGRRLKELGWSPRVDFEDGLARTVGSYLS